MRKLIFVFLTICLVYRFAFAVAEIPLSEHNKSGDYLYLILEDGTAEITRSNDFHEEVIVPSQIDGICVSTIADGAFVGFNVKTIIIPNEIINIVGNPFAECSDLRSFIVSSDHPTLEVVDGVLFDKLEKRLICYPKKSNNTEYIIPDGTISIENFAFQGTNIRKVIIPDSVSFIGYNPFLQCLDLQDIYVSPDNQYIATINAALFEKKQKRLVSYLVTSKNVEYNVPAGIIEIGDYAFSECNQLKKIILPDSLVYIGSYAFYQCKSLLSITIPNSVSNIGKAAFMECNSLDNVILPSNITSIESSTFYSCSSLSAIKIPERVVIIDKSAFAFCDCLKDVLIFNGLQEIGDRAFLRCGNIKSIILPDSISIIGKRVFESCDNMMATVGKDSFARQYCIDNNIRFTYADSNDWLEN